MHLHASGKYCRGRNLTPYRDLGLTRSVVDKQRNELVCAVRNSSTDSRVMNQRVDHDKLHDELLKINNWQYLAK